VVKIVILVAKIVLLVVKILVLVVKILVLVAKMLVSTLIFVEVSIPILNFDILAHILQASIFHVSFLA